MPVRVVTWNMQGNINAPFINTIVETLEPAVLCLQECGNLAQQLYAVTPFPAAPAAPVGFTGNFIAGEGFMECVYWRNVGSGQGGVAIMTNIGILNHGVLAPVVAPIYNPANPRHLPWIDVRDTAGTVTRIYSIHAPPVSHWPPPPPVTIGDVCDWVNAQIANVAAIAAAGAGAPANWAIVGDFNADPTAAGFVAAAIAPIHGPYATHQGGSILDYMNSNVAGAAFVPPPIDSTMPAADHYAQVFLIP